MDMKFQWYKLVGDVTYPVRPWMYCLFKGENVALSDNDGNWNVLQSSMRTCVERAFGILKGIWRLIMKQ